MKVQLFIFGLILVTISAANIENEASVPEKDEGFVPEKDEDLVPKQLKDAASDVDSKKDKEGRVFFAFYSSTYVTLLVTATQTALSTCVSTTASPACFGRRNKKKDLEVSFFSQENGFENMEVESSLHEVEPAREISPSRVGKKLTLWSTSYSTLTITTTSYLSGTTVTISLACAIPGFPTNTCFG